MTISEASGPGLTRRRFLALTGAGCLASGPAFSAGLETFGGHAFGSYWRIALATPGDLAAVRSLVETVVASTDAAMSPYLPSSDVSRFNRGTSGDWAPVSPDLHRVVSLALRVAGQTGAAFDPTVGPIVARYGFGPITGASDAGLGKLDLGDGMLRKRAPGLTLDLCGIAKGDALDRITDALLENGINDFVAELGGEVACRGRHPQGRDWRIAVAPDGLSLPPVAVAIGNRAVATSGLWPQGYELRGHRYSHIIDPRKGAPANGDVVAVSVVATTAALADALATALCSLPSQDAVAMAERLRIDALFTLRDGQGGRQFQTGRFADWRVV